MGCDRSICCHFRDTSLVFWPFFLFFADAFVGRLSVSISSRAIASTAREFFLSFSEGADGGRRGAVPGSEEGAPKERVGAETRPTPPSRSIWPSAITVGHAPEKPLK